ncbi:molybdopterin dinucleotide-binding region [Methanocaldococcus villosus KIN24-T80]|uniref:Molybdopterin dinucleotide-binding region n=1 Tax=Methanocaldococcus villosus KIN24-T80 TaxID=1069083 RepID=N6VS59_9EURY|nr:tungsten-dependent formylmethanofuran dehydrogenase subunit FwdD [Methanocaldococcus villosus]ENN96715.1 molybdopterin dinucleotide-binding region [Methanocaldococcus villosus KIN24-T80]
MKFKLNTGRTIWQGQGIEAGKNLELYRKAAAIAYMNEEDMKKLNVKEGDKIKVKSEFGEVVVYVKKANERLPEGSIYIPMGPWANLVVHPYTDSTGMPYFKGDYDYYVEVEKTDEEVLSMEELMKKYYIK